MNNKISLKDFLIQYTAISKSFINQYFKFYELCDDNFFGINIENVLDYLDIKGKNEFYDRFRKKYIINVDYIIEKKNQKKIKGKKNIEYYINFDTFEKICMMSKSEKANSVRDYFITLRKFIDYYKNNISKMILNNALLNPNKCVYIILVNKNKQLFKIGKTENIKNRLRSYLTGKDKHPDIKFIMLVDNPLEIETCVKSIIGRNKYKENFEIYKTQLDAIKKIIVDCAGMKKHYDELLTNKKFDAYIIFDDKI